jgi:threonine dehydratase
MTSEEVLVTNITLDDVHLAAERIRALARNTPLLASHLFSELAGVETWFKCENLQTGGAFKIRGALNFLMALSAEDRKRGVVTFSSGNHAQAVAMAAAHLGVQATIVMPTDAPRSKVESTRRFPATIVFFDRLKENREAIAARIAEESGATVIPSYDHPLIVAGQGTVALEILNENPNLESIVVPVGGGGLLSGTLIVAKTLRPGIRVFGAEPQQANDWALSLKAGHRTAIAPPATIADGLRTNIPGAVTFPIVKSMIEDILLVSEDEIKAAVRFLLTRMKLLTEPSGAVGAAAVMQHLLPGGIRSTGVILSGGNVDLDVLADICVAN